MNKKSFFSILFSIFVSVVVVTIAVNASTTISTNITTDGNLTVTGISKFNGQLQASSTALFTDSVTMYSGLTVGSATAANSTDGTILFKAITSDPAAGTQGGVYYNSVSKVLKLSDGTSWFTIGTTTSGISLQGARLQLGDLTTQYLTLGTTTQQASGQALVTLEATTTASIPLVLVAYDGQTGNIFNIRNAGSQKLLYVTSSGNLFATGTLQVTGAVTTYGATTLGDAAGDTVTLTGNTSALGTLNVTGLTTLGFASTTAVSLDGVNSNLMINGMATTTASTGNIGTVGKVGAGTTTPTTLELSAESSATTTIAAVSTTSTKGACIQLKATDTGALYRMYVNTANGTATTTTNGAGFIAVWEPGSCK